MYEIDYSDYADLADLDDFDHYDYILDVEEEEARQELTDPIEREMQYIADGRGWGSVRDLDDDTYADLRAEAREKFHRLPF